MTGGGGGGRRQREREKMSGLVEVDVLASARIGCLHKRLGTALGERNTSINTRSGIHLHKSKKVRGKRFTAPNPSRSASQLQESVRYPYLFLRTSVQLRRLSGSGLWNINETTETGRHIYAHILCHRPSASPFSPALLDASWSYPSILGTLANFIFFFLF